MVFGDVTGRDPRSLGEGECSAFELNMPPAEVRALQRVAFDQLTAAKRLKGTSPKATAPARCSP